MEGIQNLKDKMLSVDDHLRVILYGPAGGGKTTLAATFPKPFLFNFDKKLKSVYGTDVDYKDYSYDSPKDAARSWKMFWKDFRELKRAENEYETYIFDSLTAMDAMVLCHCSVLAGNVADAKPDIGVYREQSDLYRHLFMEMNSISHKNVVLIAHQEEVRDKPDDIGGIGAIREITPLITGKKIRPKLPAMFEDVWYLTREMKAGAGDELTLWFKPHKRINASSVILRGKEGKIVSGDLSYNTIMKHAIKEI